MDRTGSRALGMHREHHGHAAVREAQRLQLEKGQALKGVGIQDIGIQSERPRPLAIGSAGHPQSDSLEIVL